MQNCTFWLNGYYTQITKDIYILIVLVLNHVDSCVFCLGLEILATEISAYNPIEVNGILFVAVHSIDKLHLKHSVVVVFPDIASHSG